MANIFPLLGVPTPGYTPRETRILTVDTTRDGVETPDYKEVVLFSLLYGLTPVLHFPLRNGVRSTQTILSSALEGKFGLRLSDFTENPRSVYRDVNISDDLVILLELTEDGSGAILDYPSLVGIGKLSGYFDLGTLPEGITYSDITIRAYYIDSLGGRFNGLQAAQVNCQSSGLWIIEGISEYHRYNVVISIPGYNDIIYSNKATSDHVPPIEPEDPEEPEEPEDPEDPIDPEDPEDPIDEDLVFEVTIENEDNLTVRFQILPTVDGSGGFIDTSDGGAYESHEIIELVSHTFDSPGTYQITVSGDIDGLLPLIPFPTKILSWGKGIKGTSYGGMSFELLLYATNLISLPNQLPPWLTDLTSFFSASPDFNQDITGWNTENVKVMNSMFSRFENFNQDISSWNTSNVESMESMFSEALEFNRDISSWNTENVKSMRGMFYRAVNFNRDISSLNTQNVEDMAMMFYGAIKFNQDISSWNTENALNMDRMFSDAITFNQDLSGWCVPLITSTPTNFAYNTPDWTLPKPVWGTCPP